MQTSRGLGHERLHVYAKALGYASWSHNVLTGIEKTAAALDHWIRAAESIVENLANGNSRYGLADRTRYFDVAFGSALECAACLDVCRCKDIITVEQLIVWLDGLPSVADLGSSSAARLDDWSTSVVLNIAEGNGRFSEGEQVRFLDIAHTSAMRIAACLDLLVARRQLKTEQIAEGKQIIAGIVPLLLGLRGYADEQRGKTP